jgi:WD40 repeat protein
MKEFMVAANETNVKFFSILEHQSVLTLHNAHSDNVKKVAYFGDHQIVSASADRTVKVWDLRNPTEALSSVRLAHGIEDFCALGGGFVVANGPMLTLLKINGSEITRTADYQSF